MRVIAIYQNSKVQNGEERERERGKHKVLKLRQ